LRNGKRELVLELEEKLEKSERVDAELVDGSVFVYCIGFAAELLRGELFDRRKCVHDLGNQSAGRNVVLDWYHTAKRQTIRACGTNFS
jgi:hypothetical protein